MAISRGRYYVAVFCCVHASLTLAQSPYIREGSIGKQNSVTAPADNGSPKYRPMQSWVGERFMFLPMPKDLQHYGYQDVTEVKGDDVGDVPEESRSCAYQECVGRIVTVVALAPDAGGPLSDFYTVKLKMDDGGKIYTTKAVREQMENLAPLADLEYARKAWLGRTLWFIGREVDTYDAETGKINTLHLKKCSAVNVIDVVAGWYSFEPIRLVIRNESGEEGFVDVNVTGTNVSEVLRDRGRLGDSFLMVDPRLTYNWTPEVWSAIEESRVFAGMTAEQALMSWGKPIQVRTTMTEAVRHEQWVYPHNFLYVDNGRVTAIQTEPLGTVIP